MAYENTTVAVSKSQDGIRKMIYAHKGTGVMLLSQPPREGFEAMVEIDKLPYHIRIMATCKDQTFDGRRRRRAPGQKADADYQEAARVWRVLYWHLKAMFEAADSGVIDIRDVILPYLVTRDGRTLSEHIKPRMAEVSMMDTSKLLPAAPQ